jgi:hypothetical protein
VKQCRRCRGARGAANGGGHVDGSGKLNPDVGSTKFGGRSAECTRVRAGLGSCTLLRDDHRVRGRDHRGQRSLTRPEQAANEHSTQEARERCHRASIQGERDVFASRRGARITHSRADVIEQLNVSHPTEK